jgi:hypothetical protein
MVAENLVFRATGPAGGRTGGWETFRINVAALRERIGSYFAAFSQLSLSQLSRDRVRTLGK